MNKVKEKKLKAIKSEISEITKLVSSNITNGLETTNYKKNVNLENDTLTLTKIVNNKNSDAENQKFIEIATELTDIKKVLYKQEIILEEILLKLNNN